MVPAEQDILVGRKSNCFQACVASILEMPLLDVPNFVGDYGETWKFALDSFLRPMNMQSLLIGYSEDLSKPAGYSIMSVESARNPLIPHSVVVHDGRLVWDPSPNRAQGVGKPHFWVVMAAVDPGKPTKPRAK